MEIDPELATLEHLIHGVLQMELGYGEEISVACGNILFYDSDFTDDLAEKLSDLGLKNESFITVKDTKKLDARVDIECLLMAR